MVISHLSDSTGQGLTLEESKKLLTAVKENRLREKGIEPVNVTVSNRTAENYKTLVALDDNGVPVNSSSTRPKTAMRWVSERSLIAAMTFALVVAATHYRVIEKEMKGNFPEEATEGAVLLQNLVKQAYDEAPLYLVPPHRIMNHDDNTQYFFEGVFNEKDEIVVTHKNSYEARGRTSIFKKPNKGEGVRGNLNGQRMKSSLIETAEGTCGPPMFSMTNLTSRELPPDKCPEGFIVLKIEGLGPGAATKKGKLNAKT